MQVDYGKKEWRDLSFSGHVLLAVPNFHLYISNPVPKKMFWAFRHNNAKNYSNASIHLVSVCLQMLGCNLYVLGHITGIPVVFLEQSWECAGSRTQWHMTSLWVLFSHTVLLMRFNVITLSYNNHIHSSNVSTRSRVSWVNVLLNVLCMDISLSLRQLHNLGFSSFLLLCYKIALRHIILE